MGWTAGVFTREGTVHTGSTLWQDSAGDGNAVISSSEHDDHDEDLALGINACLHKGGQNSPTADIDWGGFNITNLAAGASTGENSRWNEELASVTLNSTTLEFYDNAGVMIDSVDISSVGSAGEVTIAGDQTITGKKTFTTNPTVIGHAKHSGGFYSKVYELTAGATVAIDTTAYSWFYLANSQAMTLNVTIPTAASDTDLGGDFVAKAAIMVRNATGHGALTLSVVGSATDTETIGSRPTSTGDMYIIQVTALVLNGTTRYVWFTYVAA